MKSNEIQWARAPDPKPGQAQPGSPVENICDSLPSRKCLRQGDLARPYQDRVGWLKFDKCQAANATRQAEDFLFSDVHLRRCVLTIERSRSSSQLGV